MLLNTWAECGGTETYHTCLIKNLIKHGHQVKIALPFQKVTDFTLPHDMPYFYFGLGNAIKVLQGCSTWIVWGVGHKYDLYEFLKRKRTAPNIICINHGSSKSSWCKHYLSKEAVYANKIVAVSEDGVDAIPIEHKYKSTVIHGPVDRERLKPQLSADEVRKKHGLKPEHKVLLYLGRVTSDKRVEVAAKVIDRLPEEWRLLVVGDDASRSFNMSIFYRNRKIIYCGKTKNPGDYFQIADCCINPSLSEGFGLTAMESIISGVPTIAHNTGIFQTLRIGMILPDNATIDEYANAVLNIPHEQVQKDTEIANTMFTVEDFTNKWLSII